MTDNNAVFGLLRKWLSSEQGYEVIQTFTRNRLLVFRNTGISGTVGVQSDSLSGRGGREHENDEIAHEFIVFILADIANQPERRLDLVQTFMAGKYRLFLDLCWNRFLWEIKDKARGRRQNPLGYLYRRFRETVGKNPSFLDFRDNGGLLYYTLKQSEVDSQRSLPSQNVLAGEGYHGWSSPPQQLELDRNNEIRVTTKWLTETASFFWKQARNNFPGSCWFAVKEIVRYTGTMFPWLQNPQLMSADGKAENGFLLIETVEAITEDIADCLDKREQIQSIALLTTQFILTLTRADCCMLVWRLQPSPLSYESISEQLGLKSHNEAYSKFEKIKKSLKNFCSNWPGPPIEDLSKEVGEYFIDCLVNEAKKICSGP